MYITASGLLRCHVGQSERPASGTRAALNLPSSFINSGVRRASGRMSRIPRLRRSRDGVNAGGPMCLVKSGAGNFGPGTLELFQQMVQLIEQAVSLDENDIECHRIMCRIALTQGKFAKSEYHLERALALNPNDAPLKHYPPENYVIGALSDLGTLVLVKPTTVVKWHRTGFRTYWRQRSRGPGRPETSDQIRDLIRLLSKPIDHWCSSLSPCNIKMRKETRADRIVITPLRVWGKPRKIAAFSFHNFE
jgi:hypothetical protein